MAVAKKHYMKRLSHLGKILPKSFKSLGIDLKISQQKIIDKWQEIVGDHIDSVSKPRHFKFRTLFVDVYDSMWLHQLVFMEEQLKEKINRFMGKKFVQKIYFKVGELPANKPEISDSTKENSPIDFFEFTCKNDEVDIDKTLGDLKDDALKEILKRIMMKGKGVETYRRARKEAGWFGDL